MINDFSNACLNVLLFVPFGFFLPVLWKEFRNANIAGTLVGYLIAYWFTGIFTRKIVKNSKKNDFYIICASVVLIMFFLQPFISSLLWEMIL